MFGIGALICAAAPSMEMVVAGRFVQGFGGGVLSAMAYVLVGKSFPEPMWPRVAALLSGAWSMAVLVGPLMGGAFATWGNWRGSFYAVTVLAALLAVVAARALPRATADTGRSGRAIPMGRIVLICLAIAVMSAASVVALPATKAGLFLTAVALLVTMIVLDRRSGAPLFPSDAFSLSSITGVAMWFALLVSIAYSPLSIFVPIFLRTLHGFDPLAAGYTVAGASMGWTVASLVVSRAGRLARAGRLLAVGPLAMAVGLAGVALLMSAHPVVVLPALIALVGLGIGSCWGVRRPATDGWRQGRRGRSCRVRGRDRAADRLCARSGRGRHRRHPVGADARAQYGGHRQCGLLGAGEFRVDCPRGNCHRRAAGGTRRTLQ